MKRTLKRELKELEFAEWKASRKVIGWQDCCLFLELLQTCVQCLWCVKKTIMAHLSASSAPVCAWKWIKMARHACVYAPVIVYTCVHTEDSVCGPMLLLIVAIIQIFLCLSSLNALTEQC